MPIKYDGGKLRSGIVTLPARVRLSERSDLTGSYPTISRTGDPERSGKFNMSPFDDLSVIDYGTDSSVGYPVMLRSGSAYFNQRIATPNYISGALVTTAEVRRGVSDVDIDLPRRGQKIGPFIEHNHFALDKSSTDDPFYLTGSAPDTIPGFKNPLRSKVKIEIDLNPIESTKFGFTEKNFEHGGFGLRQWPMVYYNFDLKRWEKVGFGHPSGDLRTATVPVEQWFSDNAPIGFSAGGTLSITGSACKNSCLPITDYGFPIHPKFHATSSQALDMSQYIQHPFVLEKFAYEFKPHQKTGDGQTYWGLSNLDSTYGYRRNVGASLVMISSFFIMNQRRPYSGRFSFLSEYGGTYASSSYATGSLPMHWSLTSGSSGHSDPTWVDTNRDLVTYGQFVRHYSHGTELADLGTSMEEILESGLARELNVGYDSTWPEARTYVMSGTVKQTPKTGAQYGGYVLWGNNPKGLKYLVDPAWDPGGRNAIEGTPTGRDLVASQVGDVLDPNNSFVDAAGPTAVKTVIPTKSPRQPSPYVILPKDKLVFGWHAAWPQFWNAAKPDYDNFNYEELQPGAGKLILYGSLIRENVEVVESSLNQALTSDSIHEMIHEKFYDQFDTEPSQAFSGSYVGEHVTGDILRGTRKVTSNLSVNAGGRAFLRGVPLVSSTERFYDTVMPDMKNFLNESQIEYRAGTYTNPNSGQGDITLESLAIMEDDKRLAYPYQGNPNRKTEDLGSVTVLDGTEAPPKFSNSTDIRKLLFRVGQRLSIPNVPVSGAQGFRYGIMNTEPKFTKAIFRWDRFGQFRDMLEQRLDGKFLSIGLNINDPVERTDEDWKAGSRPGMGSNQILKSPVQVSFFSGTTFINPTQASGSINISIESTSSVPFRDRDRPLGDSTGGGYGGM